MSVMKRVVLAVLAAGLMILAVVGSAASQGAAVASTAPPHVLQLATVPGIGAVFWRSRCSAKGSQFALGVRVSPNAQSAAVRFRAGRLTVDRNFNVPTGATSWFRFHRTRVQRLAAVAGGENGYTLGAVQADFRSGGCGFYDPPRVTVQVYPRRPQGQVPPAGPGSILRPWRIK
jgi:hypothetical protein